MQALRWPLPVVLLMPLLGALSCTPVSPPSGLACERDNECASGRCEEGRCAAGAGDAGGAPVDDAGRPDGGTTASDASLADAGAVDAGRGDGGQPVDSGAPDAGALDGGAPPDDGGGQPEPEAGVPDDDAGSPREDAATDAGGTCGDAPPIARAPIEVCLDGWDNDEDGSVDELPCGRMRTIVVAPASGSDLPAGYSVALPVSGLFGDDAGEEEPTGADVRLWRYDGPTVKELHRVLDPGQDWSAPATLWFALDAPVSHGAPSAGRYRLTWGALPEGAGPPLDDEDQVFHFADFFDDAQGATPGWTIEDDVGNGHDINIRGGALVFDAVSADENGFPRATRDFAPLSGRFLVDFGFHWTGADSSDDDYAWRFLVGGDDMAEPPDDDGIDPTGVGPNLIWGFGVDEFGLIAHQSLAVDEQVDDAPFLLASGVQQRTRVRLLGNTSSGAFRVLLNGEEYGGLSFLGTVTEVSRVRVYPTEMATHDEEVSHFANRQFEHVIVRPAVAVEPTLSLSDPPVCE